MDRIGLNSSTKYQPSETPENPVYAAYGEAEQNPGYWARRAIRCHWPRCLNHSKRPETLLYKLRQMDLQREPTLQMNTKNLKRKVGDGLLFDKQVSNRRENVEALLGQAVGKKLLHGLACQNCLTLDGKFTSCVRMPGMQHCANCHWGGEYGRCSLLQTSNENPNIVRTDEKMHEDVLSLDAALAALKGKFSRTTGTIKTIRKQKKKLKTTLKEQPRINSTHHEDLRSLRTTLAAYEQRLARTRKTMKMVRKQKKEMMKEIKEAGGN
ncbi:hypothetical protein VN97_g13016 [Penicillium thymicola]|uniref:Uncharacterized protein n=1 Tax=Penicillium thymicola TaxID=293382 RepID=A0AAI9X228_PENTH|nr:hypothetical protein VN97_g13016 [Penicillium thymicola]